MVKCPLFSKLEESELVVACKYSNYDMEMEFKKCIPNIQSSFKTITGEVGVILEKEEDLILLRDLLDYYNGKLTVDIVRLVLNSLYNIECFIKFNGLIHNGISIDNYFISISLSCTFISKVSSI